MLDINQRRALMETLKQRSKKASSSVSTKVEAQKGDFSVVITNQNIDHIYKGQSVGQIRVASLENDVIELIDADPQQAAQEMLDSFASSFDTQAFEKSAATTKEAAHETVDAGTAQMITQKQLDDKKPALHPREDSFQKTITQKQLPEAGMRPGTYEEITEAQMAQEKKTFYNEPLDAAKRLAEDRNIVTEGQLEAGTSDYSDHGKSDRGEVGAKFDGDLTKQVKMIGEKQLAELLKHHEWKEPLTITEGKDQLGSQDGELSRVTAEIAGKILREAFNVLGSTVIAAGVTPQNLLKLVQKLVSHPSKFPVLADTIGKYVNHDVSAIQEKLAKAQYFGKVANIHNEWSDDIVADVLVRQLAKLSYNPKFIVQSMSAIASHKDSVKKIDEAANSILQNKSSIVTANHEVDIFAQALEGENNKPAITGSAKEDGLYEYIGTIEEIQVPTSNKDEFTKAAAAYASKVIKANIDNPNIVLEPQVIDVNEELGSFKIQMKDTSFAESSLQARANARRKLAKEAQFGGGGGGAPQGGPEMGNPMAPPTGGDMGGQPAGETFSQEPPPPPGGEDLGGAATGGEPKPPGAICPVDGSEDVDVDNGEFRCNSCGAEGTIHVRLDINKWPETIHETGKDEAGETGFGIGAEDDQELGGDLGSEPAPGGEGSGTTMPNVPIAASVRITPLLLQKIAKQNIELGTICPNCGGHNTESYKSASVKGKHGICYDCSQEYNFQIKANPKQAHRVFAQYIWTPTTASNDCDTCSRLRSSFVKSLSDYGMKIAEFNGLSQKAKADTILKMAELNTLNLNLDTPISMNKYAAAFKQKFDKFPSASCMERIARKFGENATAMAGPCQGKPLADCVCRQLENLGIYNDGLASKVAHSLNSEDPMLNNPSETCVRMFMNEKYTIKQACTICDGLRAAVATDEDLIIEAIAQVNPYAKPMSATPSPTRMAPKPMKATPKPMPATSPIEAPAKPMLSPVGPKPMGAPSPMGAPAPMPAPKPMGAPSPMGAPAPMPAPMPSPAGPKPLGDSMPGDEHIDVQIGEEPGLEEPGMSEPGLGEPGLEEPGLGEPGMSEPGLGEPGMSEPGLGEPGLEEPGMDDGFGDTGLDLGEEAGGGDLKTILIDTFQGLIDALQGNLGENAIDTTGDSFGDDSGIDGGLSGDAELGGESLDGESSPESGLGEEPLGESSESGDSGNPFGESESSEESSGSDIPGVSNESSEGDESLEKESKPAAKPTEKKEKEHPVSAGLDTQMVKEASASDLDKMLYRMKQSTITKSNTALDNLIEGLANANPNLFKAAKKDDEVKKVEYKDSKSDKITTKPAQEAKEIGKIKDGGKMGHEEKFDVKGPDVPRGDATIGEEGSEVKLNDSDRPSIPHGSGTMKGEGNYKPEKGNVVDGNQGGQKTASQDKSCKGCSKPMAKCMCKPAETSAEIKSASCNCNPNCSCKSKGSCDGNCGCKTAQKNISVKKESQVVSPKSVKKLEDDPDLNRSGKTHADETHSLGVSEKKPSEGMSEPEVPEAPNGGQLEREHTYDNALEGPSIPAGGGMNSEYDQNEKNTPEKLDQTLGKENNNTAMAETNQDRAVKIAGLMLKMQKITIDELPNKISELSKVSSTVLDDYEKMMKEASSPKKGLQKAANGACETSFQLKSSGSDSVTSFKDQVQSLFRLDQRNRDHESHSGGNPRLWH